MRKLARWSSSLGSMYSLTLPQHILAILFWLALKSNFLSPKLHPRSSQGDCSRPSKTEAHLSTIIPLSKDRMRTDDRNSGPGTWFNSVFLKSWQTCFHFSFCWCLSKYPRKNGNTTSQSLFFNIGRYNASSKLLLAARWYPEIPRLSGTCACLFCLASSQSKTTRALQPQHQTGEQKMI